MPIGLCLCLAAVTMKLRRFLLIAAAGMVVAAGAGGYLLGRHTVASISPGAASPSGTGDPGTPLLTSLHASPRALHNMNLNFAEVTLRR
jgi:disulfide bond formation protein DsbB